MAGRINSVRKHFSTLSGKQVAKAERKDHRRADKHPLPTDIRSAVDHSLVPSSSSCTPIKTPARTKTSRQRAAPLQYASVSYFLYLGRPRIPVGITSSTRISRANEPHPYIPYSDRQKRAPPQSPNQPANHRPWNAANPTEHRSGKAFIPAIKPI